MGSVARSRPSGQSGGLLTAVTETIIGITLVTGRFVKVGLVVLAGAMAGILSPMALFPDQMWSGNGPTLTGQYVFKDRPGGRRSGRVG